MPDSRTSVVLVDDAPEVRMLLRTALQSSGRYEVVGEGGTGADAIELARASSPAVIVLDVSMPVMDGLAALPLVLTASPNSRVVLYTGFDPTGLGAQALALGATAVLQKSAALDRFADDLDAALTSVPSVTRLPVPAGRPAPLYLTEEQQDAGAREGGDVLDEHLERFREVFEEAAIGMATMTLAGRLVRANRALGRLLGRDHVELTGVPYADLVEAGDQAALAAALVAHESGSDVAAVEHGVLVGPARRRLAATVAVARDSNQRPLYLFLQLQDVTTQRQTEEALRTSEQRFALLVEAVQDYAIFMLDPQGYIVSWNPGAQRAKGYAADEIIGRHFRVFYPPEQQAGKHPEHELELAAATGHYEEEGWRVRKDGTRFWANVVISAVRNQAGTLVGYAKVTRDISERREMVQRQEHQRHALASANRQLAEANAQLAASIAQQAPFVAVTGHELRNPISVLTGASTLLVTHWDELSADERADLLDSIKSSSARLNRLLADLLTTSRLESGAMELHLQPARLGALLDRVAAAGRQAGDGVEISVDCPPDLVIDVDPDRLAQAVENLVINATRYGTCPILVSAATDGDSATIRVQDHGPGVADELVPRLFERFATGRAPGGTGLGLFIVRELARAHGGDVHYEAGPLPAFVITVPIGAAVR